MENSMSKLYPSFLTALLPVLFSNLAFACYPISSAPVTLTIAGRYCLTRDVIYLGSGSAINTTLGGITIDFQGYSLGNASGLVGVGVDVRNASHVTIENGVIENFETAIRATEAGANLRVRRMSIRHTFRAIDSTWTHTMVDQSHIQNVLADGDAQGIVPVTGVKISGAFATIKDTVFGNISSPKAVTALALSGDGATVLRNSFSMVYGPVQQPARSVALYVSGGGANIADNVVTDAQTAFQIVPVAWTMTFRGNSAANCTVGVTSFVVTGQVMNSVTLQNNLLACKSAYSPNGITYVDAGANF
jgi:hypothetical protein